MRKYFRTPHQILISVVYVPHTGEMFY